MIWNQGKSLLLMAFLTMMGVSVAMAAEPAKPVVLAPDGAWCWFGNPRALFKNGVLYASYVRHDGHTALSAFDSKTGIATELWSSSFKQYDDHNNAGLLELSDGRLLAIYAKHHQEKKFYYRHSLNANPLTPADWGEERISDDLPEPVTYSNPYQLKSESGRVYNFLRCVHFNPNFMTSDDSGEHWSKPRIFIKTKIAHRPYVQYCSDYDKRIDFFYTEGHPDAVKVSLFHGYIEGGSYYRTDGKFLRKLEDAPLLHDAPNNERGTLIYPYKEEPTTDYNDYIPFGRPWCWDMVYDKNKAPVVVFSVNPFPRIPSLECKDRRLYYYYARWNGTGWTKRFVAQAGTPLDDSSKIQISYAGGITIDPHNPDVIYLSSNAANPFDLKDIKNVPLQANNRFEIYRGVTTDGGLTFTWQPVTVNSEVDNLRPYVPRGNTYSYGLTWFAGTFNGFWTYKTSVMGVFAQTLEPFSTTRSAIPALNEKKTRKSR